MASGGRKRDPSTKVDGGGLQGLEQEAGKEDAEIEKADGAAAPRLDVPDLRSLLNKRKDERLFSAAKAGIVPAFLLGPPGALEGGPGGGAGEAKEPPSEDPESELREESMEDASEDDSSSDSDANDSSSDDD